MQTGPPSVRSSAPWFKALRLGQRNESRGCPSPTHRNERRSFEAPLLVLDEPYHQAQAGFAAVDRAAVRGNRDGFHVGAVGPLALPGRVWPDFRNEPSYIAVLGAPDVDAILEARATLGRLCVGDIQH